MRAVTATTDLTKAYTRIIATEDGGSAFEDAAIELTEQQVAAGVPPMFVGVLSSAGGVALLRSVEFDSEPHPAPRKQWVLMLRGAIEVQVSDGTRRRFKPGDVLFVSDTTGRGHVTSTLGAPPFESLFVAEGP